MLQDTKGYLWFGTSYGLYKFDGYSFTNYNHEPQDSSSLIQNYVFSIWEDKDGMIWVGTYGNGLYIINPVNKTIRHLIADKNARCTLNGHNNL